MGQVERSHSERKHSRMVWTRRSWGEAPMLSGYRASDVEDEADAEIDGGGVGSSLELSQGHCPRLSK